ncbi:helix-turn-helix transcriptional regulator [Xanthobacter sp. TB0139]|uniref:helix-turn-helix transcriptional regulator n=1 Tax=Xanthobacter sp. TB0139 TaxID=3459178 RepID=UPI004038FCBB
MSQDSIRLEKVSNLLRLAIQLASTAEGLTLDEIAREFDVSRRTAERMRDTVRGLFPAFDTRPDGAQLRFFINGGLHPFMVAPTAAELAELDTQIRQLEQTGHSSRATQLHSLTHKIQAAMRGNHKRRMAPDLEALCRAEAIARSVGPSSSADERILELLRTALLTMKQVQFIYASPGKAEEPAVSSPLRTVVPYGLLFGRNAYLVGQQVQRSQPVLWRLDRMSQLHLTEEAGAPPDSFDLDTYAARSFGTYQEQPSTVVLHFTAQARAEAERTIFHPTQKQAPLADGGLEVTFTAGGLLEIAHHLFTWGDQVDIIEPDALRSLMVKELERALNRHKYATA